MDTLSGEETLSFLFTLKERICSCEGKFYENSILEEPKVVIPVEYKNLNKITKI